ncbi:DUF6357 family protein, partial [Streptomyces sp. NPDC006477]|uniref:DUF6357 family protein n=1 Tax=Streptomyces sp. NPDC006477 TaxID=3364747 RepID=UPI003677BA43
MSDIVFTRTSGWIPNVIREDGELKLTLGAGADANHEPRTFTFSISEAHLAVIREDLARHLLLWSAVLPLCDAAGTRGRLDENAPSRSPARRLPPNPQHKLASRWSTDQPAVSSCFLPDGRSSSDLMFRDLGWTVERDEGT